MARLVFASFFALTLGVSSLFPTITFAAEANKGLTISPVRQELTASKDKAAVGSFIVSNFTGTDKTINLSTESFSVANYSYDYAFQKSENDWVKIRGDTQIQLKTGEERKIVYDVVLPATASPGGHYYALLASIAVPGGGVSSTLRVASLLYLTVEGAITKSSTIENGSLPKLTVNPTVPYSFDVKDTGNTHFSVTSYARVGGQESDGGGNYLLMPEAVRTIRGSVQLPTLPGYYAVAYGYRDAAGKEASESAHIIYVPIWFVAFLGAMTIAISGLIVRRKRSASTPVQNESE